VVASGHPLRFQILSVSRRFVAHSAASLYSTTVVTSALGFAFWSLAAHRLPPIQVGDASAVVSAMQLLAMLSVLGLNTLIISEVSARPTRAPVLIATASTVALAVGLAGGLFAAVVAKSTSAAYMHIFATTWALPIFVVGVGVTTITLVVDDACVAARRPALQLFRNSVASVLKLSLIPVGAIVLGGSNGMQLLSGWVLATIVSLWFVRRLVVGSEPGHSGGLIDLSLIRSRSHLALRHHWLNVSVLAPRYAVVAIAAVVLGPRLTAAFYAALLIVGFVTIIPSLLTTVLFTIAPGDDLALTAQVRFTLGVSAMLAVVAAPVIFLLSGISLSLFSPADLTARAAMCVLGLTVAPLAVKTHYVVIARVRGRMGQAARRTTAGAALELTFAGLGGAMGGLDGMAIGWLIALGVEAVVFGPTVYRAAFPPRGPHS